MHFKNFSAEIIQNSKKDDPKQNLLNSIEGKMSFAD